MNTTNRSCEEDKRFVTFDVALARIMADLHQLLQSKRHDYGDPTRTLGRFGVKGLVPRIVDKVERLVTLTWEGREPKNESVRDTLLDLAGYAVLGLWLLDVERGER